MKCSEPTNVRFFAAFTGATADRAAISTHLRGIPPPAWCCQNSKKERAQAPFRIIVSDAASDAGSVNGAIRIVTVHVVEQPATTAHHHQQATAYA